MEDDGNFCPTLKQNDKGEKNPRMEDDDGRKLAEKFAMTLSLVVFLGLFEFFLMAWFISQNPLPCDQMGPHVMSGFDYLVVTLIFCSPLFALYAIYWIFKKK
jgi:hypothetical protein